MVSSDAKEYRTFNGETFQGIFAGTKARMSALAKKRKEAGYKTRVVKHKDHYVLYIKRTPKVKYPLPKGINKTNVK